jgi:ABC-type amino acid transport substrate-binding protein
MEMRSRLHSRGVAVLGALVIAAVATGCGGGGDSSGGDSGGSPATTGTVTPDHAVQASLKQYGWAPDPASVPNFACKDDSYAKAVSDGVKLGFESQPPYGYVDGATKKPTGIDWEIVNAALHYAGIAKVDFKVSPFDTLIPAVRSNKIDIIMSDIHETTERFKQIAFTSPGWWYGPALLVQKGNPKGIQSYDDLTKDGVSVGAVTGSAAQIYLEKVGAKFVPYQDGNTEFASLEQGRETAVLEDDTKFLEYKKVHPDTKIEIVDASLPPAQLNELGYGYARYGLRKGDCSLNAAMSRGLAELRGQGVIGAILKKYGLGPQNVNIPGT